MRWALWVAVGAALGESGLRRPALDDHLGPWPRVSNRNGSMTDRRAQPAADLGRDGRWPARSGHSPSQLTGRFTLLWGTTHRRCMRSPRVLGLTG